MTDTNGYSAVSIATADDEEGIMELCRLLHAENGIATMDDALVRKMLQIAFNRDGGTIGVIRGPKRLEAAIYLLLTNFWYSKEPHIEEMFAFVHPEHRRTKHADLLIEFAKNNAEQVSQVAGFKIPLVIGILTNSRTAEKVRLYKRRLGYPAGAMFVHNATWPNDPAGEDFWSKFPRTHPQAQR
jgi:GNAT superfamily N-acetyltransferase